MMFRSLVFATALAPTVALAAPAYVGEWAAEGLPCEESITITQTALEGLENSCRFDRVDADGRTFVVQATCSGEGQTESWSFVMETLGDDILRLTDADTADEPITYARCDKLVEH